ncbi:HEAT repeat domain-containing protein [Enhygromyxa salina]|uniref:HEAT repeat domain-containing protein n=1 Tax=Enhygromyxa salina TaxID=215803 RepID=UPI000D027EF2|nr:HEAT repeat domain-containing protein [Enhygromyxa salina]
MAYDLSSTVSARGQDGALHPETDEFSAVVSAHVVAASEARASLQIALSEVELRQNLAQPEDRIHQPLGDTFEIDVAPSCRIVEFRFPQDWSDAAQRLVAGALRTHEHVLQSDATWEVDQTDTLGRYRAQYTRTDNAVSRRKVLYYDDNGLAAFGMKILVPHASARASFDAEGIVRSDVRERVQIRVGSETRADLDQRSLLVRDDSKYQAPAAAEVLAVADPFVVHEAGTPALPKAPASLAEARALYEALAAVLDPFTVSQARSLAGLIAAYPSLADDLVARLEGDELGEVARSSIFWALELAATDHARAHLTSLVDSPRPNDRIRAAVALSAVAPTLEVGQRLLDMYYEDLQPTAATAGLLALGVVGANGDESAQRFARESIGAAFEDAQTHGQTLAALSAMGNTGDPEFMPQLAMSLHDEDPSVRGKAAEAMRHLGDDARPHLQAALEIEVEPGAAKSVMRTLREIGPPRRDDLGWAAERLDAAPSIAVRGELIAWLAADPTAEGSAILIDRFHTEPSSALRQLIGRYVPASELR